MNVVEGHHRPVALIAGMDEVWLEGLGVFLGVTWVSGSWQWEDGSPATSPSSGPALPADNSGKCFNVRICNL